MAKKYPRLTKAEWRVIWDCLMFVDAGERDGGPLQGDDEKDGERQEKAFKSAIEKLRERDF